MEFFELTKLAIRAFINWMFHSKLVTATEEDHRGFHLYGYEGTPSVTPGFFVVRFRHVENGMVVANKKLRMTEQEWGDTVALIENRKEQAV
ncbi:TPA: hypothetical protein ACYLN4_006855 [Burkholderia lata]